MSSHSDRAIVCAARARNIRASIVARLRVTTMTLSFTRGTLPARRSQGKRMPNRPSTAATTSAKSFDRAKPMPRSLAVSR